MTNPAATASDHRCRLLPISPKWAHAHRLPSRTSASDTETILVSAVGLLGRVLLLRGAAHPRGRGGGPARLLLHRPRLPRRSAHARRARSDAILHLLVSPCPLHATTTRCPRNSTFHRCSPLRRALPAPSLLLHCPRFDQPTLTPNIADLQTWCHHSRARRDKFGNLVPADEHATLALPTRRALPATV